MARARVIVSLNNGFKNGDKVTDITAEENQWEDVEGTVIGTYGPWVRVRYKSRRVRTKTATNLRLEKRGKE